MKRLAALLMLLVILSSTVLTVSAHDVPQERNDCSIEITVRYDGKSVSGGTLTAVKVGCVDEEDGNYYFCQEMTGIRLDDIASSEAPKVLKEFYDNNKDDYDFYVQTQSVKDGKATFSGLPTGLYPIVQKKAAKGFNKMSSFLVTVPYLEDGTYQYHVTAAIKSEIEREPEPTKPKPPKPSNPSLPQTGQMNWPIPAMVTTGLVLFVTGWTLCFGKKRNEYEN